MKPLVTVVCLCYNHEKFLTEALRSVSGQSYPEIEIIIVNDASTDNSKILIKEFIKNNPSAIFIDHTENKGNCSSFNEAFRKAKGKYIIDFATDDVMLPGRIEKQVASFEKLDASYGVVYTDSELISESGEKLKKRKYHSPSGDIYADLVERYFVDPATMMIRREVLDALGGYDETLQYEDFDFWVRSSRIYKYHYLSEVLTQRRIVKGSHSSKFYRKGYSPMLDTTFRVCRKALWLNESHEENVRLVKRIRYEMKQAFVLRYFELVKKYYDLLKDIGIIPVSARFMRFFSGR